MSIDDSTLRKAANALYSDLGTLDDITPELRNTIANVYYKFFVVKRKLNDPNLLFGSDKLDTVSTYKKHYKDTMNIFNDHRYAKEFIKSMRETRKQDEDIYRYLETFTLDNLKYRIPDAEEKTGIRRAFERIFRKPKEIPGLYKKMVVFW